MAEQGNAQVQYNLGRMPHFGQGVPKNDVEAVNLYRRATDKGFAPAQSNLGRCTTKVTEFRRAMWRR